MMLTKHYALAITTLFFIGFYPQSSVRAKDSDIFKSSEFLTWKRENQELYIDTSIGMAGLIAARNDKAHGDCLEKWYFKNQSAANEQIFRVMRQCPEFHPRGVIVAVMEKQCGSIIYANR